MRGCVWSGHVKKSILRNNRLDLVDQQMKKRIYTASSEGVCGMFAEYPALVCVSVTDVVADDWGLECTITDLSLPGMHKLRRSPCRIGAVWECLDCSGGFWYARYVAWRVFFDPQFIKDCLTRAKEKADEGEVIGWNEYRKIFIEYYERPSSPQSGGR